MVNTIVKSVIKQSTKVAIGQLFKQVALTAVNAATTCLVTKHIMVFNKGPNDKLLDVYSDGNNDGVIIVTHRNKDGEIQSVDVYED